MNPIVIYDENGVAHDVYNKTEARQLYERHRRLENWCVRTMCNRLEQFQGRGFDVQADTGDSDHGDIITCLRCLMTVCDHGVTFDVNVATGYRMSAEGVRRRWPRLDGECPKGCGFHGIAYASHAHYVHGDW